MKKAIVFTIALIILLSFSGCTKTPADNSTDADAIKSEITKTADSFGLNAGKLEFGDDSLYVELSAKNAIPETEPCVSMMFTIQKFLADNSGSAKKVVIKLSKDTEVKAFDMELKDGTAYLTLPSDGVDRCTAADITNYMDAFAYLAYNMPADDYENVNIKLVNDDGEAIYDSTVRFSKAAEKRTPAQNADASAFADLVRSVLPLGLELTGISIDNHAETPAVAVTLKCSAHESASVQYINDLYDAVISRSVNEMNIAACTIDISDAETGDQLMYYYGNYDIGKTAAWMSPEIIAYSGPSGAGGE